MQISAVSFCIVAYLQLVKCELLNRIGGQQGKKYDDHSNHNHGGHGYRNIEIHFDHMEGSGNEMDIEEVCDVTGTCPTPYKPNCCWLYHTADHENCCFCANDANHINFAETGDVIMKYHVGGWCSASTYVDMFRHNEFQCCTNGKACCVSPFRKHIDPHGFNHAHNQPIKEFHNGHLLAIIIVCVGVFVIAIVTACILRVKHKNAIARERRQTWRFQTQSQDNVFDPPPYDHIMKSLTRTQSSIPPPRNAVIKSMNKRRTESET